MDCNALKNNINLCKAAIDGFAEEKIDFDIIIPDYCAAAGKILKCEVIPSITSKSFDGDKVILEGNCTVNVLYVDENAFMIRSISESAFFTQSHTLKQTLDNYRVKLKLRPSNVICRLQNSRRISVKALLGVAIKVIGTSEAEIITGFDDDCIETRFDSFNCCMYNTSAQSDIRINSEIQAKTPVLDIIKCNASIKKCETELINDRAIIKGECKVSCLYTAGDSPEDVKNISQTIPFSEILQIEGSTEDDVCDLLCEVTSLRCSVGNSDEQNIINVEVTASADAALYTHKNIQVLNDVYSRENEVSVKRENIALESLAQKMRFESTASESIDVDFEDFVIDDVSAKPFVKNISLGDDGLVVEGEISASLIMHNDNEYKALDRTVPFKVIKQLDFEFDQLRCEVSVCADDVNCFAAGSNVNFECEMKFDFLAFIKNDINAINEVNTGALLDRSLNSKIVLYYADKGEGLWDIAKKYSTSVDILKRDNKIDDEKMTENCILLISNN